MNKLNIKTVINAVTIITIFILFFLGTFSIYSFAVSENSNEGIAEWSVGITSEGKDLTLLEETQTMQFKVENNPYVVANKIAPGVTAVATIDIDLTKTEGPVDVKLDIDKSKLLNDNFKVVAKLDGQELNDNYILITENCEKTIRLELTWDDNNNEEDTFLGINASKIEVPVTVTVEQHI